MRANGSTDDDESNDSIFDGIAHSIIFAGTGSFAVIESDFVPIVFSCVHKKS